MNVVRDKATAKDFASKGAVGVTSGIIDTCGITRFSKNLTANMIEASSRVVLVDPRYASFFDKVVINFEHGVMSRTRALRIAKSADKVVAVLHTIIRDEDDKFVESLNEHAYTVAMHPYAEDYVDDIILHPSIAHDCDVIVPKRVSALGVFGLIRPGKGIEAAIKLASELGLGVYVRGEALDDDLVYDIEEFASLVGVDCEVETSGWTLNVVRSKVEDGILPIIPSLATSYRSIWASGTEADLIGARVPYISYPALGGHNPCAYAIEFGGPSYISMFTEGVEAAAKRAAGFVKRVKPVEWRDFAAVVTQMLE